MRRILTLVRKDFYIFLADPISIGLGFVVPLVMILVFGFVFGGSEGGIGEISVLAVNEDAGPAGARLLRDLDALDELRMIRSLPKDSVALDSTRARRRIERGANSVALIVPADFSTGLKHGELRLTLLEDPHDPLAGGIVSGLLQKQVFSTFPGLMPMSMMQSSWNQDSLSARAFNTDLRRAVERNFNVRVTDSTTATGMFPESWLLGSDPDSAKKADTSGFSFDRAMNKMFKLKREAVVGQNVVNPGIAQSVAGPAVMFMLFAVGGIAASLLREMRFGTSNRLRVCGVRPGELLFAKYLYAVLLGMAQLIVMMLYGRLIFGLDIFAHPLALLGMILVTSLAMSGIALFIAALGRTEEQATGYQVVIILAMSAVGGAMFPSFIIPAFIRNVGAVTPVHWAMQGFHNIFWRGRGLDGILLESAVLLGMAALLVGVSVIIFRKRLRTELG